MREREEKREREINTCNVYVYREVHTYRVMSPVYSCKQMVL